MIGRGSVLVTAGISALLVPMWWNLSLRWTGTIGAFSRDLPFRVFRVSWQDTGSGMFTLAGAGVALAVGVGVREPAGRVARLALLIALSAFLIDIYLY